MVYIILGSILLLRVVQSITGKSCSKLLTTNPHGILSYMSLRMGLSALTALIMLLVTENIIKSLKEMSIIGWLLATLTGITITVSSICSLLAMKKVPVVLSSLFGTAGLLVPTIAGIFIYNQPVSIGGWVGIMLLFGASFFLSSYSKDQNGKLSLKSVLLLFGNMMANGSTMLLQTLYKTFVPSGSVSLYSFLQFCIPSVFMLVIALIWSVKIKQPIPAVDKKLFGFSAAAAVALFGISQISTIASATVPVAVLFPISDGGGMIISATVAAVVFKEKFTVKSVCGIILGIIGILMIKLLV